MIQQPENRTPFTCIFPDSIVADVLRAWPETIPVFLKYRLGCVGCDMAPFDTVSDVTRIYRLDPQGFLEELRSALIPDLEDGGSTGAPASSHSEA